MKNSVNKYLKQNNSSGYLVKDRKDDTFLFNNGELIPIEIVNQDEDGLNELLIYKREICKENEVEILYGLTNQDGLAVTPAIYTYIEILKNGNSRVSIFKNITDRFVVDQEKCCEINGEGFPLVNGIPVKGCSFVQHIEDNFWLCWSERKVGLCNGFGFLLIPCEYDSLSYRSDWNVCQLEKDGETYSAIMGDNGSIVNIIKGKPIFKSYHSKYLVAWWTKDSDSSQWFYTLLDSGGIEILHEHFSEIEVFSDRYVAVKRNDKWSLYYISFRSGFRPHIKEILSDVDDISYGVGRDKAKIEYVAVNNSGDASLYILQAIGIKEILTIQNGRISFSAEEYDPESMDYKKFENSHFVVEIDGETTIYNLSGEKVAAIKVPENCKRLMTHTFGEGLIGFEAANGRQGYLDLNGNVVIPANLECGGSFVDGKAIIKKRFTDFYLDEEGRQQNVATCVINKKGKVLEKKLTYERPNYFQDSEDDYDWRSALDDAMEGDSGAYWNID